MGRHRRPNSFESGYQDLKFDLRRVKSHGIIFSLSLDSRFRSADAYRESLEARKTLAQMKLHERLAQTCDQMTAQSLREQFAESYREVIGVYPDQREEFRQALERVKAGAGMTVQDVIDLLRIRR